MKILFISDYGLHHTIGGAQRSNDLIIRDGISRGHDISVYHYDNDPIVFRDKFDIVISSNLHAITHRINNIIEWLHQQPNHVRLEHDLCPYLNSDGIKWLWSNCKISFFLTDYHHQLFLDAHGDHYPNVKIVPDPIDRTFFDRGLKRSDEILACGFMHPLKGTERFIEYASQNPDKRFLYAGWGQYEEQIKLVPNINFVGQIEHSRMPEILNHVGSFYHVPIGHEPFCRAVGEAIACGVPNLIISDNIGAVHHKTKLGSAFEESCYNATTTFWEHIECL